MSDLERKFGKYAIRDLSLKLVILYAIGYAIQMLNSGVLYHLTLDPYAIIHGQVWRLVSWLLIPPNTGNIFFTLIMLFFYYSIGTSLERVWGTWQYNVFILTGIGLTIASAFVFMGVSFLTGGTGGMLTQMGAEVYFSYLSAAFSTYYINVGIFFAYALTFPDAVVLMFFIIPMKVKWLGVLDVAYLVYEFVVSPGPSRYAIAATFINIAILYFRFKAPVRMRPSYRMQSRGRSNGAGGLFGSRGTSGSGLFGNRGTAGAGSRPSPGTRNTGGDRIIHRCAICGRTQQDSPDLEFRFCSKCEGNYEYCQDHLFTHVHVRSGEVPHM